MKHKDISETMASFARVLSKRFLRSGPCLQNQTNLKVQLRKVTSDGKNWCQDNVHPTISSTSKVIDTISFVKNSETLEARFPQFKCIPKQLIEDATKDFRKIKTIIFSVMPDGTVLQSAKQRGQADMYVKTQYYVSSDDAKKRICLRIFECNNNQLDHEKFQNHAVIEHYTIKFKEDLSNIPNVEDACIRSVENTEDLRLKLKGFTKVANKSLSIKQNESYEFVRTYTTEDSLGYFNQYEYINLGDNDVNAILITVTANSESKELKRLEKHGFLQIYSAKKQTIIQIDKILDKMKKLQDGENDFSIKDFDEIESDKNLEMTNKYRKFDYKRATDGSYKNFKNLQETPKTSDLVCQKYLYESESEPDVIYSVLRIFDTTEKDLEPFVGKAFIQKVEEKHQTITIADEVIEYMQSKIRVQKMNLKLFGDEIDL